MSYQYKWVHPSPCKSDGKPLNQEQVDSWRQKGFVLVDGLFPADLLERVSQEVSDAFPSTGTIQEDFGDSTGNSFLKTSVFNLSRKGSVPELLHFPK